MSLTQLDLYDFLISESYQYFKNFGPTPGFVEINLKSGASHQFPL